MGQALPVTGVLRWGVVDWQWSQVREMDIMTQSERWIKSDESRWSMVTMWGEGGGARVCQWDQYWEGTPFLPHSALSPKLEFLYFELWTHCYFERYSSICFHYFFKVHSEICCAKDFLFIPSLFLLSRFITFVKIKSTRKELSWFKSYVLATWSPMFFLSLLLWASYMIQFMDQFRWWVLAIHSGLRFLMV